MCTISFDVHIRLGLLMHIRLKGHISSWIFWARMCGVDGHQPPRLNVVTCSTNLCKLNRHHSEIAYIHGYEYCSGQCLFIFIYTVYLLLIICVYIQIYPFPSLHDFFLFVQLFFSGHRCSSPFIAEGLCGSNAVCAMAAVLLRPTPVKSSIMEKVGCPKRLVTDVAAWSLTSSSYSLYQLGLDHQGLTSIFVTRHVYHIHTT